MMIFTKKALSDFENTSISIDALRISKGSFYKFLVLVFLYCVFAVPNRDYIDDELYKKDTLGLPPKKMSYIICTLSVSQRTHPSQKEYFLFQTPFQNREFYTRILTIRKCPITHRFISQKNAPFASDTHKGNSCDLTNMEKSRHSFFQKSVPDQNPHSSEDLFLIP